MRRSSAALRYASASPMSGMGIIRFDVAAAKRNRRAKMSDTAIVSEQSGETRSRGSGAGFGGGDCITMGKVV